MTKTNGTTEPARRPVGLDTLVRLGIPLQRMSLPVDRVEAFASSGPDDVGPQLDDGQRRAALALLGLRDVALLVALVTMPDITRSMGISAAVVGFGLVLGLLAGPAAGFPVAARIRDVHRRRTVLARAALVVGPALVLLAMSPSAPAMLCLLVVLGAVTGVIEVLAVPLVTERNDRGATRIPGAVAAWTARVSGAAVAMSLVALVTGPLGLTWRAALLAIAVAAVGVSAWAVVALGLAGSPDEDIDAVADTASQAAELKGFEVLRRLSLMESARRSMTSGGIVGLLSAPLVVYTLSVLGRRQDADLGMRAVALALVLLLGGLAGTTLARRSLAASSPLGDAFAGMTLPLLLVAVAMVLVPFASTTPVVLLWSGAAVAVGVAAATLFLHALMELTSLQGRGVAIASSMTFFGPVGVIGSLVLASSVDRRFGEAVALAVTSVALLALARSTRRMSQDIDEDLRRWRAALCEEAELVARERVGLHVPMLTCRSIDFSYGQLQVLFGVDFTVDEGEMVALLGTNGAGKSTLLRVISGLGLPNGGRVHFGGQDITYLDPERRVSHGIAQIPGGKAVFGPMTVVENLRVFGHSIGRSPKDLDAGIEATLATFPRLDERRNQLASTLSGGEQQLLALGKALLVKPRLLLIDELSLGLAPIVVGQLLEMVRQINAEGTAVVLVEQSVNVALSLVDHAYFMEKGQIRFDGPAGELLNRRDLLRSVFLEGVGQGG